MCEDPEARCFQGRIKDSWCMKYSMLLVRDGPTEIGIGKATILTTVDFIQ
jgi:hypothetical protein